MTFGLFAYTFEKEEVKKDKSELSELTLTFIIIEINLGCH